MIIPYEERPSYDDIIRAAMRVDAWEKLSSINENIVRARRLASGDSIGFLLNPENHPDLRAHYRNALKMEREATGELERAVRRHPLIGPYVKNTVGIGEKSIGRLIGQIGDPGWNTAEDRPRRGPDELKRYCGMDVDNGQAPRRKRGVQSHWSNVARARVFVIADSAISFKWGHYRAVYDLSQDKNADAVHTHPCPQCGASGPPAPIGSPLRAGHKHARARRELGQKVLIDLWRVSNGMEPRYAEKLCLPPLDERVDGALKKKHKKGKKKKAQK